MSKYLSSDEGFESSGEHEVEDSASEESDSEEGKYSGSESDLFNSEADSDSISESESNPGLFWDNFVVSVINSISSSLKNFNINIAISVKENFVRLNISCKKITHDFTNL